MGSRGLQLRECDWIIAVKKSSIYIKKREGVRDKKAIGIGSRRGLGGKGTSTNY